MAWDRGAADDLRVGGVVGIGSRAGHHGHQVVNGAVDRGLAGTEEGGQGPGCWVCSQVDENEQDPCVQWSPWSANGEVVGGGGSGCRGCGCGWR